MGWFFKDFDELNSAGLEAMRVSDYAKAERCFNKAITRAPGPVAALYYNLAIAQVAQEKEESGLQNMQVAAEMGDEDAQAFLVQALNESGSDWGGLLGSFLKGAVEALGSAAVGVFLDD